LAGSSEDGASAASSSSSPSILRYVVSLFLLRHPRTRVRDAARHHVWGGEDWAV
jgi:hypothetical protein